MKHLFLVLVLLLAGCPRHTRKTLVPDVPQSGNASARTRFLEAKNKFLRDGSPTMEFKKIVEDFPNDPIVPWAELYAGIAAVKARNFADADAHLSALVDKDTDPGLIARAELFLGITKNYEGDTAAARKLLPKAERAVENDDERSEYLAALAYATAAGDRPLQALPIFDQLYSRVSPPEKALIVQRCEEIVATADRATLERWYEELGDRKGPALAAVGTRLVALYAHGGEAARAAKLREQIAGVRAAVGLSRAISDVEVGPTAPGNGDAGLIGAIVPLGSKKSNRVAEQAVAGLGLAAGAPDGKGIVAIETRVGVDKTTAAEAVDSLARQNVVAIIGPIDSASVDGAVARAESLGVPLLSLATTADQRPTGKFIFHVRHSPEHRARTLATRALGKGIKTFVVLAPETAYGKGISDAFAEAVKKRGGSIVATVTYPADTKAFTDKIGKLPKSGWDGVFVADEAKRLGLIAPALAAAGQMAKPLPLPKKVKNGRPILLLSTAEGLDASYLADAGRHSEGALLAPGFFPDSADPVAKPFIDRFVAAYGRAPEATEAYAYDAAQLAAAAAGGGRAGLAQTVASSQLAGVTGTIRFDADHRRSDGGVIYTVAQETGGALAIRAAK